MSKKMVKKGLTLPESHREAIANGLRRYWSMHEMNQERRNNISKAQKARLAKRDISQIKAHKEAISRGTKKYYTTHDGPWSGISPSEETKERISQGLLRYWKERKQQQQQQ